MSLFISLTLSFPCTKTLLPVNSPLNGTHQSTACLLAAVRLPDQCSPRETKTLQRSNFKSLSCETTALVNSERALEQSQGLINASPSLGKKSFDRHSKQSQRLGGNKTYSVIYYAGHSSSLDSRNKMFLYLMELLNK